MKIRSNGKIIETETVSLTEFLRENQVKSPDEVSIELNGRILYREEFEHTMLQENDIVEFFYFMGGGHGTY